VSTNQLSFFPAMTKIMVTLGPKSLSVDTIFARTNVFEMPTPWMLEMAWQLGQIWSRYKKDSFVFWLPFVCVSVLKQKHTWELFDHHTYLSETLCKCWCTYRNLKLQKFNVVCCFLEHCTNANLSHSFKSDKNVTLLSIWHIN
jgi:hypothetical protein